MRKRMAAALAMMLALTACGIPQTSQEEETGYLLYYLAENEDARGGDMIRGSYEELVLRENYQGTDLEDYLHVILTDENDIPDVIGRLRSIYPNIMKLDYDNQRTRRNQELMKEEAAVEQSPMELLGQFFSQQNNQEMSPEQTEYARTLLETIRKEEGVE